MPGWGVGLRLGLWGRPERLVQWHVVASYWPERRVTAGGATFAFGLTAAALGACLHHRWGPMALQGCLDAELGVVHSVVYRPTPRGPGDRLWGALYPSLRLRARLAGRLWLVPYLSAAVPFQRRRYRVQGREVVFQPRAVAPLLGIDVEVTIGEAFAAVPASTR